MKFCRDCKHLCGGNMCSSPQLGTNLVTGVSKRLTAEGVRGTESRCGQAGYWFEPKSVTKLGEVLTWLAQK